VLFEQYHLRQLDEPFLLVTARSGTSTLRSPGSAQVIVVYSLGPSCASILASAPDKALWITPEVNRWLDKNKRVTLHFTPTSGSWLNMVEIFFGIITRQAIRGAAPSPASKTSSPPSRSSSTAGTNAANPSSGPRPPTRSSRTPRVVKDLQ